MNRDYEAENMTASEWRVRSPQRHPAPPTSMELSIIPLLCMACSLVVGLVVGFCLGLGYAGGVR